MSIVSCYIIVNADTTIEQDFDRHQRIQITTADYSSVHLLLPCDHAAAATFLNNLITTCAQLVDHIQQPHEPDTVKTEPAGATSNAHDNPAHTSQPGPHERLNRGQIIRRNSAQVLRASQLADVQAAAEAATERTGVPIGLMFFAFMIAIGFPSVMKVLAGLN